MKKHIYLYFCIYFLSSCGNHDEYLIWLNDEPQIHFEWIESYDETNTFIEEEGLVLKTKIKKTNENGERVFLFPISLVSYDENQNLKEIRIPKETEFYFFDELKGENLGQNIKLIENNSRVETNIICYSSGSYNLYFTVVDKLDVSTEVLLKLDVLENEIPISILEVTKEDNLTYKFDASQSYDGDNDLGGEIIEYVFEINGAEIKSENPILYYNHLFPNKDFNVNLIVIDNDFSSSIAVNKTVTI